MAEKYDEMKQQDKTQKVEKQETGEKQDTREKNNVASPITVEQLKGMIDRALEGALPRSTQMDKEKTKVTLGKEGASIGGNMTNGEVEHVATAVHDIKRDVDEIKLMKYELAAVKGALKKFNTPSRSHTPMRLAITPRMLKTTKVVSLQIGAPCSTTARTTISAPSILKNPRPTAKAKSKRSIDFSFQPITEYQLLRLRYTDLKELSKIHGLKYVDKAQAIATLRKAPGLIINEGRDFVHDSDKETRMEHSDEMVISTRNQDNGDSDDIGESSDSDEVDTTDKSSEQDINGR
ncbi:hypothetical protein CBR_g27748 [Chara braunii]|uniref:Uncharacterized protein n=1 Tax=Chara braunii TaxID=69332 RepID=A0A388L8K6_CHABU|nr:hypothetical protein CBR_g27748 [Chara braunii]|eukprot:GBG78523.1 hypothetical protein CBR_g27748 [Chara braunii]